MFRHRLIKWVRAYSISAALGLLLGQLTFLVLWYSYDNGLHDGIFTAFGGYARVTIDTPLDVAMAFLESFISTIAFTFIPVLFVYAAVTSGGWTVWWRFGPVFAVAPLLLAAGLIGFLKLPDVFGVLLLFVWFVPAFGLAGLVFGWLLGPEHEW